MSLEALDNRRTPERRTPLLGGIVVADTTPATVTVGSAGTVLTAAQVMKGLIPLNCTDAGNLTLPTAALLAAGIPGLAVGGYFEVQFINFGDSTASLVMGPGITNKVIDSEDAVLDIATHQALRVALVCTELPNPSDPSKAAKFDFYGYGVTSAATS